MTTITRIIFSVIILTTVAAVTTAVPSQTGVLAPTQENLDQLCEDLRIARHQTVEARLEAELLALGQETHMLLRGCLEIRLGAPRYQAEARIKKLSDRILAVEELLELSDKGNAENEKSARKHMARATQPIREMLELTVEKDRALSAIHHNVLTEAKNAEVAAAESLALPPVYVSGLPMSSGNELSLRHAVVPSLDRRLFAIAQEIEVPTANNAGFDSTATAERIAFLDRWQRMIKKELGEIAELSKKQ